MVEVSLTKDIVESEIIGSQRRNRIFPMNVVEMYKGLKAMFPKNVRWRIEGYWFTMRAKKDKKPIKIHFIGRKRGKTTLIREARI